ncbi:hypothetical protein LA080_001069 [Diaporthe eres]|nr:hypothetical protein LA080_001069 [Diaporthe eres]
MACSSLGAGQLGSWHNWMDERPAALGPSTGNPHRQQGSPLQRDLGSGLWSAGFSAPLFPFPFRALATGRVTSAAAGTVAVDSVP